jgi:putative tryptophan/tyrosine transport system substrate-binding protein
MKEAQRAAQVLGLQLYPLEVRGPDDFEAALSEANRVGVDSIYVVSSRLTVLTMRRLVQFATKNCLPLVGGWGAWAKEGGLFRTDLTELQWRVVRLTTSTR